MPNFIEQAAALVDRTGRFLSRTEQVHPLDDPAVWRREPLFAAPSDVNIEIEQRWIDSLMGTVRTIDGESSKYKLVWNGDRQYWYEFFHDWLADGRPSGPPKRRPRIRYEVIRNKQTRRPERDIFPPRWLILRRLEPEQFVETWKQESWVYAPEINCMKLIRPEEPPKVFWMWYTTIAHHTEFCCATKAREKKKCYGQYRPPGYARQLLEDQKAADRQVGVDGFDSIDYEFFCLAESANNGYEDEVKQLEVEAEVALETPWALLGVEASIRAGIKTTREAERIVREHFDREIDAAGKLANRSEL